jgi:PAS domain S-box-containing protein
VVGVITIFVFFIGLKKYRRDLAESSNKFRIVSEFAHNLEYWINKDQQIVFISPSCERITGYSIKDFEKNPALLGEMTHPEDKELYEKNFADMKKTIHEDFQYRIVTKSGQTRWISHTCNPIHLVENYLGQRGSIKDITNQKALEDQLIQAQKVECLGHFAGGIAHDFNNVLSSITTFAHLLDEELQDRRSDLVKYVNYITIAAKLGRNLTSNLLAFGRPQIIRLRVTNINGIIRNISDIIKSLLTEEIEYTIELTPREKPIFADYHQIEQIIINLCTNARDSMPSGGQLIIRSEFLLLHEGIRKAHVDIPAGGYMILSVSDTGRGISPEDLPNIFEPFYSTKEKKKGTGLGLVIISNIVKQHNAFIDVDSKPGSGTTFQIYFPVTEKVSSEEEPLQTFEEQPSFSRKYYEYHGENDETGNAILLVEDEELVRESLYAILELRGYSIFLAKNGAEAIEEYRKHQKEIGLVVLDVMLPKKNGLETYKAIKEINNSVKAVFISGYTKDADITREIIREGLDLLEKPLNIEKFMDKVGKLLPE